MSNPEFTAPNFNTQTATAYKTNLDAAIAANGPFSNLGFSYSGGTFTVHGHEGTALASTNPAFVRFQDPDNFGHNKYISVEANQDFIDDAGSSEIVNNLFGLTTGVAYGSDVPFYLYAVSNDDMDTVAFMISRTPGRTTSPAFGDIGAPDDAVADNQFSFFSLESLDETLYDSNPCVMVGSFRMQMSASDDWTVQALGASDGIGQFQEDIMFDVPLATFGAGTSSHFRANGGTAPIHTSSNYKYIVDANRGFVDVFFHAQDVSSAGVGAVSLSPILPFTINDLGTATEIGIGNGWWDDNSSSKKIPIMPRASTGNNYMFQAYCSDTAAERNMQNTYQASSDDYSVQLRYKIAVS